MRKTNTCRSFVCDVLLKKRKSKMLFHLILWTVTSTILMMAVHTTAFTTRYSYNNLCHPTRRLSRQGHINVIDNDLFRPRKTSRRRNRPLSDDEASTTARSLVSLSATEFQYQQEKQQQQDEEEQQRIATVIELARRELVHHFDFPLDDWQLQAGGEILMGHNVIVSAPTGSGKTVVGEMALHYAFDREMNGIYTTPLKALSNQKFSELRQIFGPSYIGLSTGDMSVNRHDARITVMTTEVYRNIAWRSSSSSSTLPTSSSSLNPSSVDNSSGDGTHSDGDGKLSSFTSNTKLPYLESNNDNNNLDNNAVVVLDEFHYMGQPGRGGVWEECVITSPQHTQIIGLSATLPNAVQLAEWMESVTGRKTVLVEAPGSRPVPLRYLFATRAGLFPLFRNPDAGPGAPLGLLGYRGDGIPAGGGGGKAAKRKTTKGFGAKNTDVESDEEGDDDSGWDDGAMEKLPRGLQVNPALKASAQKRLQRVNRALERQKVLQMERWDSQGREDDWDIYGDSRQGGGRGRSRGRDDYRSSPPPPLRRRMTAREEQKERERLLKSEMRKAVPSLPILLTRLKEKRLLPAIFFIFSRAGCDQAAQTIANNFKGPRDPTMDMVDFDDIEEERGPPNKKRQTRQRGRRYDDDVLGGIVEDADGRSFRLSSNYVSEDVFSSVLEGSSSMSDSGSDSEYGGFEEGSPLSSTNWNFYSTAGLLSINEVQTVASRIGQFNDDNPEIAFSKDTIEQYLLGVGSHHAGMLPAHKAFVEGLYRGNLMKAIFATSTLSAGLNMPCRTTVVCALAKRGDAGSMSLLETSDLLQMSGRAGRRGMDTEGTCVIVATPFESEDEAARILTDPIKPIASQFRPSYSLAVNLVIRGDGKLDVARQLVRKSFAMWEKLQLETSVARASEMNGVSDVLTASAEDNFISVLIGSMQKYVGQRSAKFDVAYLKSLIGILKDREELKRTSKSFIGVSRVLELEQTTLEYLEIELKDLTSNGLDEEDELLGSIIDEDQTALMEQIGEQRKRTTSALKDVKRHPFSAIADVANQILEEDNAVAQNLYSALRATGCTEPSVIADDLCKFAKSSVVVKRKMRKLAAANPELDPESLLLQAEKLEDTKEDSWDSMIAITKVLVAYGCLASSENILKDSESFEERTFEVTPAGVDVGMLGFENSLWCFVALGGTWDVLGASSKLDEFREAMNSFDDDFWDDQSNEASNSKPAPESSDSVTPNAQKEAELLVSHLRFLSPGELAGYVSCLVSEGSRGGSNMFEMIQRMTPRQQKVIQVSLGCMERLVEVQRQFAVDERTCPCQLDISNCEVVTAWASGASWTEVVELSGAAPGDLARTLSRALDAVRQFGNLKYTPVRKSDIIGGGDETQAHHPFSRGLHPDVRRLCREAANAMNRYPVKDQLPFEAIEDELFEDDSNEIDVDEDGGLEDSDEDNDRD